MNPLVIYLGDLTYTTISLATEAFPLNIGFVAAYAKKKFGADIDLQLFKYIEDLQEAIRIRPPHILGMSNYPWNYNLGLEIFKMVHESTHDTICVMGGPNIPLEDQSRDEFIQKNPAIDFYSYLEGEEAFSNLINRVLSFGLNRSKLKTTPVDGMIHRMPDGSVMKGVWLNRRKELDEIPSPYLSGFMDKFFDGKLSPIMETNRGCPFSCSFCHEGNSLISRVNFFSLDRVKAELDYIADKVAGTTVTNLMFADPNFAMYERDFEIVEHIEGIQNHFGWPRFIFASTGKNKKERVAKTIRKLNGTMTMWMSVQSMEQAVLKEIRRENIKTSEMMALAGVYQELGLPTLSEIILALPGDSYERHISSIAKVVDSGVDVIATYSCMLLNGTELNTKTSREKYGIRSHFRVLPRDFAKLCNGKISVEVEEIITSTNTLSFEDYITLRKFHLIISVVYNGSGYGPLFKFFNQKKISVFEFLKQLIEDIEIASKAVRDIFDTFSHLTKEELWNTEQELKDYFSIEENYQKLVNEELGLNLIQTHQAKSYAVMDDWSEYVFTVAEKLLAPILTDTEVQEMVTDIRLFCTCRTHNIWGDNRNEDNPKTLLQYDVSTWWRSGDQPLSDFKLSEKRNYQFYFPREKQEEMQALISRFGNTPTGIGRIICKTNRTRGWRESMLVPTASISDNKPHVFNRNQLCTHYS